jgi:hypothetical protein
MDAPQPWQLFPWRCIGCAESSSRYRREGGDWKGSTSADGGPCGFSEQGQHQTNGVGCSGRCVDGMQELGSRGMMIRRDSEEMDDGSAISRLVLRAGDQKPSPTECGV